MESTRKRVIVLTDGDHTAYRALSKVCEELSCHPLRASAGNPTPMSGQELLQAIQNAPQDPVVVMVDDRGDAGTGKGENALQELLESHNIDLLGVVAVAANTHPVTGVEVQESVDRDGEVVHYAVDKEGQTVAGHVLKGDTVDVLGNYSGVVVGLGDPGKMNGHDAISRGVPATRAAIEEILKENGIRS